jgi:hypothetical protein
VNTNTDLDINRAVRRLLVKHWVDLGRVSVRTSKGRVIIYGNLRRVEGQRGPLTTPIVDALFYEISRIREVKNVKGRLENWINEGGRWREYARQDLKLGTEGIDSD